MNRIFNRGFTLIEVVIYMVIASLVIMTIFSTLTGMFRVSRQLRVAHEVQQNVRFVTNIINNYFRNCVSLEDIRPDSDGVRFYSEPHKRAALHFNNGQLEYYEEVFDQVTGTWIDGGRGKQRVTTDKAVISNWSVIPVKNSAGTAVTSALISFTMTIGGSEEPFGYYQGNYQMVVGTRY